jgi:hypothetical protein
VDDVGAIGIANVLHKQGTVELLGVMVNTHSKYGGLSVGSINTYYGHPEILIATLKPLTNETSEVDFASILGTKFANEGSYPSDPKTVYRTLLASNKNVTIVSIGYFDNLVALLDSPPNNISSLNGVDLIKSSVNQIVMMGGEYPRSVKSPEFNFAYNATLTGRVVNDWPTRMVFSGVETGEDIVTGIPFCDKLSDKNPVREAYRVYSGCNNGNSSWDLIATYFGIFADKDKGFWKFGNNGGYNKINEDGSNEWVTSPNKDHHFIRLNITKEEMANRLDNILLTYQ